MVDEARREIVEQFRMSWNRALTSEVVDAAYDAFAEMELPDAIHEDSRGEWIVRLGQPLRES